VGNAENLLQGKRHGYAITKVLNEEAI